MGDARPFEWWMTSNLALGFALNCFLPVLLPTYVLSAGGTATDVWVATSLAWRTLLQRASRRTESIGVLVSASPSPVLGHPA